MKYICNVATYHFSLAGIKEYGAVTDLDSDCFAFNVYGIEPDEFISYIKECKEIHENPKQNNCSFILNEHNLVDNLRIVYNSGQLSITRGNLKVLYYGNFGSIYESIPCIEKANARFIKKFTKEMEEHAQD